LSLPLSKLPTTLFLWFSPQRWVSSKHHFGKWSIIDVFVLLMILALFQIEVNSPNLGFLPQDLYSINLLVMPLWGLYAYTLAQLVSQVSIHFVNHYHRKSVSAATESQEIELQLNEVAPEKLVALVDPLIPGYGQTIPRSVSRTRQHHLNVA